MREFASKVVGCIRYWKQGVGLVALVLSAVAISACPLPAIAAIFGEALGYFVHLESWALASVVVFGPYWLGRHYRTTPELRGFAQRYPKEDNKRR